MLSGQNNLIVKIIKSILYIALMILMVWVTPKIKDLDCKWISMFASSIVMIIMIISIILLTKCWDDTDEPIDPYGDL